MDTLRCLHIIINTAFVIYLSLAYLINSRLLIMLARILRINPISSIGNILLLIFSTISHVVLMVILVKLGSFKMAVLISSFLFLHWSYWLYFNDQRFASIIERPSIVSKNPLRYPMFIFGAGISSVCAVLYNVNWPWISALILLWFIYGFICAEIAIRKRMKRMNCDRKMAKFAINSDLGRNIFHNLYKYPFP